LNPPLIRVGEKALDQPQEEEIVRIPHIREIKYFDNL
jgi:hypothetical protein